MTQDLAATNMWLAVIALVSLAEFLIIVAAVIAGFRLYRRASALIDRAESTYVAPLADKLNAVVDEAQEVVRRVQRLEARGSAVLARVEGTVGRATRLARARHVARGLGGGWSVAQWQFRADFERSMTCRSCIGTDRTVAVALGRSWSGCCAERRSGRPWG